MRKHSWKAVLAGVPVTLALALAAAAYFRPRPGYARAFVDAGPFYGQPIATCPADHAAQRFALRPAFTLEVFDATDSLAPPVVALRDHAGHQRWCVGAPGDPGTVVRSVRFFRAEADRRGRPILQAQVVWDFGPELSTWYLDRDFRLLEYWYAR